MRQAGGLTLQSERVPPGITPALHRPFANPVRVEHLLTRLVEAFVGMRPEVVALGLEQVRGELLRE